MRQEVKDMLATLDTKEAFEVLGELLQPSQNGPFGRNYGNDDHWDDYADAVWPVEKAYCDNYRLIEAACGGAE
jgi:hypothetical protein